MALQYSVDVRNGQLNAIETVVGTAPLLRIRTGSPPANCAAARTGTVLSTITLPSDWMAAASSGSVSKSGTWSDSSADATGTAGYWEIMDSGGTTCHMQGTVTVTGGGGDMTLDDVTIESGQAVTISSFTLTAANS